MPTTQATVHATVCILLAIWTATLWRSMHAPGVCEEDEELCSADCLGRGGCVDGRCKCDAGFTGPDCRQAVCPSNCSGHGECQDGICICQPRYGAYDCSVDRLRSMAVDLLEGVTFDLQLEKAEGMEAELGHRWIVGGTIDASISGYQKGAVQGNCEFITKRDVNKAGGSSIAFHDPVTKALEVFDVPAEMLQVLPVSCPGLRYRTCAVVGNSGTLRFGSLGDAIDAHDMVYRFNQAPTDGYEQYVGRRTTFESLNSKFAHSLAAETPAWLWRENTSSYIFFEPLKLRDTYVTVRRRYPSVPVLLFSPHFFARAHQVYDALQDRLERSGFGCFEGEKPMSGFYGTLYALAVCEQVSLFGFDPWTDSMMGEFKFRYHYFDTDEPRPGAHSFDASFFMYELMALSGRYNFTLRVVDLPQGADFGRRREHDDDGARVGGVVQSHTVPMPDDVPEKGTDATMA